MVITKINGGLGNQFFQYAAGRALAHHHQTELILDLSDLKHPSPGNTPRNFELDKYPIVARVANPQEESKFRFYHGRLLRRIPLLPRPWVHIREPHFQYDPHFFDLPQDVYLDGYWQSYLYFDRVQDLIRSELQPLSAPRELNQTLLREMHSQNSIALHIRRGDYISNAKAAIHHGVCSLDYYQHAIQHMMAEIHEPHFYVFSDDLGWAKDHLIIDAPVNFVGHNSGHQAFEDLRLISHCKHQIIANSSFSWWGAWLNSNPNKIVIGPKRWFLVNKDTRTLFPPSWLMI